MKNILRKILMTLHIDLTKNLKYDRLSKSILKKVLKPNSNCVDVGCHKGEFLDFFLKYASKGKHLAFEPIPAYYKHLITEYKNKAEIFPFALSDENGTATFNFVKNAPAYSGLKKRKYAVAEPDIEEINVELKKLDDFHDIQTPVDFIKIDVEGAELGVLKGAQQTISTFKPYILFEFGLGASDYYDTNPKDIFDFFHSCEMKISTLDDFLKNKSSLHLNRLQQLYDSNSEYYFIAHK